MSNSPTILSLFSGLGGGLLGFIRAGFRSVGAIDSDPAAIADLEYLTGAKGTVGDLETMSPSELRAIAGPVAPDVVFTSPPCKGFSGCLPKDKAKQAYYQRLNALSFRGIWLALEAWSDAPPKLLLMENVPRIQSRGKAWLEKIEKLLGAYGYAVRRTTHDCGELGGLGQHRRRFLLVARHMSQVRQLLYEPPKKPMLSIGEVIGHLPVPLPNQQPQFGKHHRLPSLHAITWLRLALIPAGGDWRDLPPRVMVSQRKSKQNGGFGVEVFDAPSHAVLAEGSVSNTRASVADPRVTSVNRAAPYGVKDIEGQCGAIIGAAKVDNGAFSVADPRVTCKRREHSMGVKALDETSVSIIGHGNHDNGPWQIADPRLSYSPQKGTRRVHAWAEPSHCIIGDCRSEKGANVADPRIEPLPGCEPFDIDGRNCHLVIVAEDGTWHRPMTTLELAALQGLPTTVGGTPLDLHGNNQSDHRQRIGNAVPPPTAKAIAEQMAQTLQACSDGTFRMSSTPLWVEGRL